MPQEANSTTLPNHIGFIVDGNRRWAKAQGKPTHFGHRKGGENLREILDACFEKGIYAVSAYVFSTENWNRSEKEVTYLMDLLVEKVEEYADHFVEKGVRIVQLGNTDRLSKKVLLSIKKIEDKTAHNEDHLLGLCFNYGGQQEIIDAIQGLNKTDYDLGKLDVDSFSEFLYHPELPDLDYVVRTSGEHRISNFMLWRAAYAELYFPEVHWPDFNKEELEKALDEFANRQRRFGQ